MGEQIMNCLTQEKLGLCLFFFYSDVKASSIFLDDKFEVRLGSLSEARVQDIDSHPSRITRLFGLSQ
jgi:hypothetical protein